MASDLLSIAKSGAAAARSTSVTTSSPGRVTTSGRWWRRAQTTPTSPAWGAAGRVPGTATATSAPTSIGQGPVWATPRQGNGEPGRSTQARTS